jgi:hypothetical protein
MAECILYCVTAFALGGLVGLTELLHRYKWNLCDIGGCAAGWFYICLNGIASLAAYLLAVDWNLYFGLEGKSEVWRVILVSSMSLTLLRVSFAKLHSEHPESAAGPSAILQFAMGRAEKSLDRKLALKRWESIQSVVIGLNFKKARPYILAVSETTLRALSTSEINILRNDVAKIDALDVEDVVKMKLFAYRLTEEITLELFESFAKAAKTELGTSNDVPVEQVAAKLQRLAKFRNRLPKA